jgi:putative ABC transport system ATP-binding protein
VSAMVQLQDATRVYDGGAERTALDHVTLDIEAGEFAAVMGPSGSGKSTLLNLVAGLDRPTSGRVLVDGTDLTGQGEASLARFRRRRLGMVFQFFHLLPSLTVLENVLIPAQLAGVRPARAESRARELLARLSIEDTAGRFPARLSGGQQQRVAIARALINEPPLLLADEPTGALDSASGTQVMELLRDLHRDGQTVLLVTHDARLAARYAERVVSLIDGQVIDDARLEAPSAAAQDLVRVRTQEAAG